MIDNLKGHVIDNNAQTLIASVIQDYHKYKDV